MRSVESVTTQFYISANLYSLRVDGAVDAQPWNARPRLAAGAPAEALVLAAAVPPLFLHATYQPHVSIGLGSTTVDLTLADAAVAAVLAAAPRTREA